MRKVQLLHDSRKHCYCCPYFERVSRVSGLGLFLFFLYEPSFATKCRTALFVVILEQLIVSNRCAFKAVFFFTLI